MSDYIVKDTELTSVANAIRIKGGTNSQLVFPNGFVSAIGNISGGGGSSDFSTAEVSVTIASGMILMMSHIISNDGHNAVSGRVMEDGEYNAVLYKGNCLGEVLNIQDPMFTPTITVTGNAEVHGPAIIITGNCTITLSVE